jgi:ectoine hydroxylase-related dioxygenase (phytanoyl-CoA dioxygenase family)
MQHQQQSASILSNQQLQQLDQKGYVSLGKLLSDEDVQKVLNRLQQIQQQEGEQAGTELMDSPYIRHPKEAGADRLADLVNKGKEFDIFYTHPTVLAALTAVLGDDFKLSSLNYRAAKPGMGAQKLHVDWKDGLPYGTYRVCNSIWLLDDFTEKNGATRIVPGSHKFDQLPQDALSNPDAPHPDQVLLKAPAGTVFIFNSHVWHGGTTNTTTNLRRCIHSYFCTSDQPQQIDQQRYILEETKRRIGKSAMKILDVK